MNFEIIAVKLLNNGKRGHLKILKPRVMYYLNHEYSIDIHDTITTNNPIPDNFYSRSKTAINVAAVVGKNGSGKSSLMDMILRLLNNLGKKYDNLDLDMEYVTGINVSLYCRIDNRFLKIHGISKVVKVYGFNKKGRKLKRPLSSIALRELFYTIIINFSQYAYNSNDFKEEGNWLNGLFHKNDGYQTPIVINPFRENGNIDINIEHHLAKSRLITLFLKKRKDEDVKFRKISYKQEAHSLTLTLNESKKDAVIYYSKGLEQTKTIPMTLSGLKINHDRILRSLNKTFRFGYSTLNKKKFQFALDYVLYKLVSICTKYNEYQEFYNREENDFNYDRLATFIKTLYFDHSHITFKLRQTLNFLKYQYLPLNDQSISFDDLSDKILAIRSKFREFFDISYYIPPPIFSTEIMMKSKDPEELVHLTKLSSGEKQFLYSISTLLYHLKNLDSIRNSKRRTSYKNVNVIMEEVELYFHPEMQRRYVGFVIDCIEKLELRTVRGINIIFVTHSPFILSDIPDSKVLFLEEDGLPKQNRPKTFGGNIHDLLANGFFLDQGFIGAFAKEKIQDIITILNNATKQGESADPELVKVIALIGEPFLEGKLMEMYYKTTPGTELKKKRVLELKEELKRLEK